MKASDTMKRDVRWYKQEKRCDTILVDNVKSAVIGSNCLKTMTQSKEPAFPVRNLIHPTGWEMINVSFSWFQAFMNIKENHTCIPVGRDGEEEP